MKNPYRISPGAAASEAEAPLTSDYEAALGSNAACYLARFRRFDDGASALGWNWAAFLVTSPWFLFRKLWLAGLLNLLITLLLLSLLAAAYVASRIYGATPTFFLSSYYFALAGLLIPSVVLPMCADWIYWRHIRKKIDRISEFAFPTPELRHELLALAGGTDTGAVVGLLAGGVFVGVVGLAFGLTMPMLLTSNTDEQVLTGLAGAETFQQDVADFRANQGRWPDQKDVAVARRNGPYVQSIGVAAGSIVIIFGNGANAPLQGERLILVPGINAAGKVVWMCGNASPAAGVHYADGPSGSTIPDVHLPRSCKDGFVSSGSD